MFKSSLRMIKTLILLCIFLILMLGYIFETQGLPKNLLYSIEKTLYIDGLKFHCDEVQVGPINGLRLSQVKLFDSQDLEKVLLSADEVKLGYSRENFLEAQELLINSLKVQNGKINLLIETKSEREEFKLKGTTLDLALEENTLEVKEFTAKWQNINLSFSGQIPGINTLFTRDLSHETPDLSFSIVSAKFFNQKIPEEQKQNLLDILQSLDALNSLGEIYCNVVFSIPADQPTELELSLNISIPEFIYQGLHCRNAELELSLKKNSVIDISKLKVRIDKNEFIGGRLLIDLKNDTARGQFDSRFLPQRIIKALIPKTAQTINFLDFTEAPSLNFEIICHKLSKLIETHDPRLIELKNGQLSSRNTKYNGLTLTNVTSKFNIKDLKISLTDIDASSEELSGKFNLFIDPLNYLTIISGDFVGNPEAIHYFPLQKQARTILKNIWKDFKWSPLSPAKFSGTYMNSLNPLDRKLTNLNLFQGKLKASNAQYNGLQTRRLESDVYVTNDYVFLDNMKVTLDKQDHAKLKLAISPLASNSYINIESHEAKVPIKPLLELFQKGLSGSLSPITFNESATVSTFNAVFPIEQTDGQDNFLICYADFPELSFLEHKIYQSSSEISLFKNFLDIQISKSQAYKGEVKGRISSNLNTKPFKLDLQFKNLNLTSLSQQFAPDSTQVSGKLSGLSSLEVTPSNEHRSYNLLNGTGSLNITNGAFFSVPILSPLIEKINNFVPFGNTSEITEIHSTLKFQGDKIFVPRLVSNGKIIAFSSNGYYDWKDEYLKFNIKTHYLHKLFSLPKPFDFDPISAILSNSTGFMNSEIKGKIEDPTWKFKITGNFKGFMKNIRNTILPFLKEDNEERLQDLIEN